MAQIILPDGRPVLVDASDLHRTSDYSWYANKKKNGKVSIATNVMLPSGKRGLMYLSRFFLGLQSGDKRQVDHKNHNPLDNRRCNLRICSQRENAMNTSSRMGTTSQFLGVSWDPVNRKWRSSIKRDGKCVNLGRYTLEDTAALAHDFAALQYHREFANFNF